MRRSTNMLVIATAATFATGCQSSSVRSGQPDSHVAGVTAEKPDRDGKWKITNDSANPEARPVARQPSVYAERPALNRPEVPFHEHEIGGEGLPVQIREAAAAEAPGHIDSAWHYVTSDIDVFVVRVSASDGCRELKIRQDGVVLLNTLNPAKEQAGSEAYPTGADASE